MTAPQPAPIAASRSGKTPRRESATRGAHRMQVERGAESWLRHWHTRYLNDGQRHGVLLSPVAARWSAYNMHPGAARCVRWDTERTFESNLVLTKRSCIDRFAHRDRIERVYGLLRCWPVNSCGPLAAGSPQSTFDDRLMPTLTARSLIVDQLRWPLRRQACAADSKVVSYLQAVLPRGDTPKIVRMALGALAVLILLSLAHSALGLGGAPTDALFEDWVYDAVMVGAAATCADAGRDDQRGQDRGLCWRSV